MCRRIHSATLIQFNAGGQNTLTIATKGPGATMRLYWPDSSPTNVEEMVLAPNGGPWTTNQPVVMVVYFTVGRVTWYTNSCTSVQTMTVDTAIYNCPITPIQVMGADDTNPFPGVLHELRILTTAITQDQMVTLTNELHNKWIPTPAPPLDPNNPDCNVQ